MSRSARRRETLAALDRDLGRLYRSVEVRAVPDSLKGLLDRLAADEPAVVREKQPA